MVLPKQNLDDKTFGQLVEEERKLIPRYAPQWTDHNLSDPGITLIDLFAWLTEITLFRINLIRDSHKLKYLKLLGFTPLPPLPAIVDLSFRLRYLFSWDEIPGNENLLLVNYLELRYGIDVRKARIEKTNGNKTIIIFDNVHNISFGLDNDKNTVKLKIDGVTKDELVANNENGKLNIYDFSRRLTLPKGEVIRTEISGKTIYFELLGQISIVPLNLEKVIVDERTGGVFDRTGANEQADLFYAPFGMKAHENNALYLGFDRKAKKLSFMVYLYEKDLEVEAGKHGDEKGSGFVISEFTWEISVLPDEGKWQTIDPGTIIDETEGFNKSGRIIFNDLKGWAASQNIVSKDADNNISYFWLRCILKKSGFQYPPRIETISINTVSAIHGKTIKRDNTWKRIEEFSSSNISNGMPSQVFISSCKPILARTLLVSVSGEYNEYFATWNEIPGRDNQRLLKYLANKFYFDWIEHANIEKNTTGNIIKIFDDRNKILLVLNVWKTKMSMVMDRRKVCDFAVKMQNPELKMYSGLWTEVDDFDGSGPDDNHYILDKEHGEIKFGDGLSGRIPPGSSEITVVRYRIGGGNEGNFKAGYNWKVEDEKKTVGHTMEILNHNPSTGGKDAEILNDAIERCLRDMKIPYTAVTSRDFEYIAMNTPGLRVAKAKAIPDYNKNDGENSKASVTIVVLPYTPIETFIAPPSPPPGFIDAICHHVDKHRLLGTQIHIEFPQFIRVNVSMTIDMVKGYPEKELTSTVKKELTLFLHPIKGWFDKKGWPIGRLVSRSEIFEHIQKIEGIKCILKISISGDNGSSLDANGNLNLPSEISTVYPGSISVIINKDLNKCRSGDVNG